MRDGLRQDEVYKVANALRQNLADGATPEVAFSLACREVSGVLPVAFAKWKEKLFETAGEPAPPPTAPLGTTAFLRVEQLTKDKDELLAENKTLREQVEKLTKEKADLEKAFLEDDSGKSKDKKK